jgi:hypothetical protein
MIQSRRGGAARVGRTPAGCSEHPAREVLWFPSVHPRTAHSMGKESYRVNL